FRRLLFRSARCAHDAHLHSNPPIPSCSHGTWEHVPVELPIPEFSPAFAARLRTAFDRNGYDVSGVRDALGVTAQAALVRGEPEPATRACADQGELGTLTRLDRKSPRLSAS